MWRCALPCALAVPLSAQLYTTDAGVQSPSLTSLRERFEWRSWRAADAWVAETRLVVSPVRQLALDLVLPVVARRIDGGAGEITQEGLGDARLAAKLALVRDDDVMRSNRLPLLLDVSLPTGDDDTLVDGVDLGRRAARGLGAFGAGVGLGGTIVRDRHRAAVAVRWWQFAPDDGFAPGAAGTFDLAWWYRLTPAGFAPDHDEVEVRVTVSC